MDAASYLSGENLTDANETGLSYDCSPYDGYLSILHDYYVPFIIAVGLVGNLLSCFVFLATQLKTRSSSYYLAALAVADYGFLCVLLVVHFSFKSIIDIYNQEGWCQIFVYLSSVCANLSVWLIVAFTVERFIAVQYPLQRPHICTVSRAKIAVSTLSAIALASQIYIFWTAGIIERGGYKECEMLPDYHDFMSVVNMVDTVVTLIIPLVLIVVMNTMIVRNLFLFSRRLQNGSLEDFSYDSKENTESTELQRTKTSQSSRRGNSQAQTGNYCRHIPLAKRKKNSEVSCPQELKMHARNALSPKSQRNIMRMLLLIDSVFVGLNLPSYAVRLYTFFGYQLRQLEPPVMLWCFQQYAMLLFYTNFSVNFLLYAMCGITFRRRMWQLLRNKLKRITKRPCVRSQ